MGREACDVLREHGLSPEWDGAPASRILVPLTWQRRPGAGYVGLQAAGAVTVASSSRSVVVSSFSS